MTNAPILLWLWGSVLAIALGAAAPAAAATAPFVGSLSMTVDSGAVVHLFNFTGAGVATVNGSGGSAPLASFTLPSLVFASSGVVAPVTDNAAHPINGVFATAANAAGAFSTSAGALAGSMPLFGVAKLCLFGPCAVAAANVSIPLSAVGAGGASAFATFAVNVTVQGAPWTTGTAAIGSVTATGFAHGPVSATSTAANPGGALRLVTPVMISTNIPSSVVIPTFGFVDLSFVPEPGSALFVGSGLACVAAAAHRRMRR